MHQIQLADQLYKQAERRAAEAGFSSVDDYIAEVVSQSIHDLSENSDHVFTPERIARLDEISANITAGAKTFGAEDVAVHFEERRKQWLEDHAR